MSSTTAASGLWFGELAAAVQGGWQAMAADNRGGQQRKLTRAGSGEQKQEAEAPVAVAEAAAAGRKAAVDGDVGRCCGAMSDTTVYLLLDRFAPS